MSDDKRMQENLDKNEIKDVISISFYCRDSGLWDTLRECFHLDATLTTSWFTGTADEFVEDSSKKMRIARHEGETQKHVVVNPWVRINGNRAVAEHDLILYQRRLIDGIELDFTTWSRNLNLFEKKDGVWRIFKRTAIYEKDRMDPYKPHEIPESFYSSINLEGFPSAIRYHCWRNAKVGHGPAPNIVLKNSEREKSVRQEAEKWLSGV